jgi:uncharacterized membrane protein YphA (DoxX/SURF4 family)
MSAPRASLFDWLLRPPVDGPPAALLVRLTVGGIFFSEGILKFVYTNQGVGRFTKLGLPWPAETATFIALLEIVGGVLLMSGLLTRVIAIPFIVEMLVAIATTKVALYFGTSPLAPPPSPPKSGWWAVLHETRVDYSQIMLLGYLLLAGPGPLSLDARRTRLRS